MRVLRNNPGFSLTVIAVLALGIGANTALFSIIDRVLLHPLAFRNVGRLVEINGITKTHETGMSPEELVFFTGHVGSFEKTGFWRWKNVVLNGADDTDYLFGMEVSEHLFELLGVRPALGRTFHADEFQSSAAPVAVIGDHVWRQRFHADAGIIGRQILLDGKGYTVIGVMGPEFVFTANTHQVWIPYHEGSDAGQELKHFYRTLALVRPGTTVQQVQHELDAVTPGLPPNKSREAGWHARAQLFSEGFTGPYRRALLILWSAVGLVLLIACANAANLLLAQASARQREFAVRASLGASRWRLARQILSETLALGIAAGVAGVGLALAFLEILLKLFPGRIPVPQFETVSINPLVLGVTCGLVLLTTLLCALPACLALARGNLTEALGAATRNASASRGANRTRNAMIAVEVALSLVLLVGAGLMLHTLERLLEVHLGFEPQNVLTARVAVPPKLKKGEQGVHYTRILNETRALPGVQAAGISTILPFGNIVATISFTTEGQNDPAQEQHNGTYATYMREISPGYFAALGVRLLRGRDFNAGDTATSPAVAIVSDELARHYWPGQDAIGKRVSRKDHPKPDEWMTIVGVIESIKHRSLRTGADAEVYMPYTQSFIGGQYTYLVVRAYGKPLSIASGLRKRIHDIEPDQPVTDLKAMQDLVTDSAAEVRFHALLLEIFAGLALTLAIGGIFAVVSYGVTQRSREIGIRSALGATPRDVIRFVLAIGLRPVLLGTCLGVAGALAATRVLQSELFETAPADPVIFAAVAGGLIVTAIAAAGLPATRATRIDPAVVLRSE